LQRFLTCLYAEILNEVNGVPQLREILLEIREQSRPFLLATTLEGGAEGLGARWILLDDPGAASEVPHGFKSPSGECLLLEPLRPGRLTPWIHLAMQALEQDRSCVLALVTEVHGRIPYQMGETFAYDEHSHGLLPLDGELNIALHHATRRALQERTPRLERFLVPGGELLMLLDPLVPEG
jgi:hypothetical protein